MEFISIPSFCFRPDPLVILRDGIIQSLHTHGGSARGLALLWGLSIPGPNFCSYFLSIFCLGRVRVGPRQGGTAEP